MESHKTQAATEANSHKARGKHRQEKKHHKEYVRNIFWWFGDIKLLSIQLLTSQTHHWNQRNVCPTCKTNRAIVANKTIIICSQALNQSPIHQTDKT